MSDNKDPFAAFGAGQNATQPVRPGRAGAAGAQPGAAAGMPAGSGAGKDAPLAMDALMTASLNPLVAAAAPLLIAAPRVRTTARHSNPAGLKSALAEGITKFEAQARANGLPNEQVIAARYILCTFLDESAASTPWGGSGAWSAQSLLVQFHNETWGGEKVFQLMSKLAENVDGNRNLLELLYVVLAFGFEGRYRVTDNGAAMLDGVRKRLAQMLRQGQLSAERSLSPRWRGVEGQATKLRDAIPIWAITALAALLLGVIYLALRFTLGNTADQTARQLEKLDVRSAAPAVVASAPAAPASVPVAAPAPKGRLAGLLQPDINAGLVAVHDYADRSVVVIKSDGFFEPSKAQIAPDVLPLLGRIAQALNQQPGAVLVTGHTDNRPIRSKLFPSNLELSQKRAEAVQNELVKTVPAGRLRAQGRSDTEPASDNKTAEGRARNRRVEITLSVTPEGK